MQGSGHLFSLPVAQSFSLHVFPSSPDSSPLSARSGGEFGSHPGGPRKHDRIMVPDYGAAAGWEAMAAPVVQRFTITAGQCDPTPPSDRPAVVGLAPEM